MLTYKKLIDQVRCRDDIPVILVANKCDLHEKRKVSKCESWNVSLLFTFVNNTTYKVMITIITAKV